MDSLQEQLQELMGLYDEIKREVRRRDKHLYERWKAGGFLIDNDIISMYPSIEKVVEQLEPEEEEEE